MISLVHLWLGLVAHIGYLIPENASSQSVVEEARESTIFMSPLRDLQGHARKWDNATLRRLDLAKTITTAADRFKMSIFCQTISFQGIGYVGIVAGMNLERRTIIMTQFPFCVSRLFAV